MPAGDSVETSELLEYYITFKICDGESKNAYATCSKLERIWSERVQ